MIIDDDIKRSRWSKDKVVCKCDRCAELFTTRYDTAISKPNHFCKSCRSKIQSEYQKTDSERIKKFAEVRKKRKEKETTFVTIVCGFCQDDFVVSLAQKSRKFCSLECSNKGQERWSGLGAKNTSLCIICGKSFSHYGNSIICSRDCSAKKLSKDRIGEGNPAWKSEEKYEGGYCEYCGEQYSFSREGLHKGQERRFCSHKCSRSFFIGENHPLFIENRERKYPIEFSESLKSEIRSKYFFTCCLCGEVEKDGLNHSVHRVDYTKENLDEENLIVLCKSCHGTTNFNRDFWKLFFGSLVKNHKVVKKGWGCEVHIVNNDKYCLKYLVFLPGKRFSFHYHKLKHETWHILLGEFDCKIQYKDEEPAYKKLLAGDSIVVEPGLIHQLESRKYSVITEVSTTDYPEDSYRIEKGD